jgi:protein-disulfide isomerase
MKNLPLLLGTIIGTLLLVVGVAVIFSNSAKPKTVSHDDLTQNARFSTGAKSPKVTIVEFADLQCPGCAGYNPILQQLLAKYPNDVQLIYRQFPLTQIHQYAQLAAQFAETAGSFDNDKFWKIHDMMFADQQQWSELKDKSAVEAKFYEYVAKLQIDKNEFQKRMESQEILDKVQKDISDGNKLGVNSTPFFFVNDKVIPAPQLVETVDSLLASPAPVSQ